MRRKAQCTVCNHEALTRIELLLVAGTSQRSIARKYGLSKDAVSRHWLAHVTPERRAQLIMGPVQKMELESRVSEECSAVLDHHRATRSGLYTLFRAALEAGDRSGGALLAGRLTEVNREISRLTGQLIDSPLITNNTVNVFVNDPGFMTFMNELAEVLGPYPEARRAVALKFEALEREAAPVPQLEHVIDVAA